MIPMVLLVALLSTPSHQSTGCTITRDQHGKIERSRSAIKAFRMRHACPSTGLFVGACPGYVVDHIWPLCAGGCDTPANFQWQEVNASRNKDVLERYLCGVKFGTSPQAVRRARCNLKIDPTIGC